MSEILNPWVSASVRNARELRRVWFIIGSKCPRVRSRQSHHRFKKPKIWTRELHHRFKLPESQIAWDSLSLRNARELDRMSFQPSVQNVREFEPIGSKCPRVRSRDYHYHFKMPENLNPAVQNAREFDHVGLIGSKYPRIWAHRFNMTENSNPWVKSSFQNARELDRASLFITSQYLRVSSHESHHRFKIPVS